MVVLEKLGLDRLKLGELRIASGVVEEIGARAAP
jgi:hypothetical protein